MATIPTDEHRCFDDLHRVELGALQPIEWGLCERSANIFRALGDINRLRLLSLLAVQEMCVTELTLVLKDNLPAISQRLKLLRSERLVCARRQGKHVYYRLADKHIAELIANGLAHGREACSNGTMAAETTAHR